MNRRVIYRDLWQLVLDQSEQQACCDVTHDLQLEESKDHYVVVSVSAMVDLADLWTPGWRVEGSSVSDDIMDRTTSLQLANWQLGNGQVHSILLC